MTEPREEADDLDLEPEYQRRLDEARARAGSQGRADVLDYINLRAANDRLRAEGVNRLAETFTALAGEANREGAGVVLERAEGHRFRVGNSWMVGTRLVLRRGLRALTIEAGWPRAPGDGVVRGGGLASARVSHFGDHAAGEELLLASVGGDAPRWFVIEKTGARAELLPERVRRHLANLVGGER